MRRCLSAGMHSIHTPQRRCLTQTLLHRDFGLNLDLPENRLCPPVCLYNSIGTHEFTHFALSQVPNRLNYILWLQDILDSTTESPVHNRIIRGIDMSAVTLLCSSHVTYRWLIVERVLLRFIRCSDALSILSGSLWRLVRDSNPRVRNNILTLWSRD